MAIYRFVIQSSIEAVEMPKGNWQTTDGMFRVIGTKEGVEHTHTVYKTVCMDKEALSVRIVDPAGTRRLKNRRGKKEKEKKKKLLQW